MIQNINLSRGIFFVVFIIAVSVTLIGIFSGNYKFILPFYTVLGSLSLGTFVYLQNRTSRINISFSLITLFAASWTFVIFMYTGAASSGEASLWSRLAAATSSFIPPLFLYFTIVFPKEEKIPTRLQTISWISLMAFFSIISLSNLIVESVVSTEAGFRFVPGGGLIIFMLYFVSFMGYAFYILITKYYEYTGISKMQIRYVFLGFLLGSIFPITTNLILPLLGRTEFAPFGPFFTLITTGFIAYAIVRHRLMSIEVVLQRGIIYTIVIISIMALYVASIMLSERVFREIIGYSSFVITGIAAIIIAILYQPFLRFLQDVTDRLFFRGRYDYQKTLKEVSHAIISIIRLEELIRLIVSTFLETMRVSEISFLLLDPEKGKYRSLPVELKDVLKSRYKRIEIDEKSPTIISLKERKEILVMDEVEEEYRVSLYEKDEIKKKTLTQLIDEMRRIGVAVWVPIIIKGELIGIISLGNKLSQDIFTSDDISLLTTLADQTALALENARLYEQVLTMKNYSEDILKSMTNAVLTTDLKGRIITFNLMAEGITGYRENEVVGKLSHEIWKERGVIPEVINNTLRGGRYKNYETNLLSKDKILIPISISSTLLKDSKGGRVGALVVITDLTEVRELESKVRQADKLAALGTMAAGMAHEIKNPLSSMKVLAQLMPKKYDDADFRAKFTEIMPREIGRIDRIIESLLGFARATVPKFEKVKIDSIIEESLKFFEEDLEGSKIAVVKNFAELPPIEVDSGQFIQVFSNLILNAIQAMASGGELKITTSEGKKTEGVLENILIEVSDTGHGIPKEYLKKLFDPFFTTKYGGTGLGLTIAHSVIDGHKGSITVRSEIGRGTTFSITLPVHQ